MNEFEIVGHSEMHGDLKHDVLNLEQTKRIEMDGETLEFETWVCFNHECNYLEFRLTEGHNKSRSYPND